MAAQGDLEGAAKLFEEELEGCVVRHGLDHEETRSSASNLVALLSEAGQREKKNQLASKHGV